MRFHLAFLLILALSAGAVTAGEAEDAFNARVAGFPAPSAADGFEFKARFLLDGTDLGSCVFSARPGTVDGKAVWILRDRLDLVLDEMELAVDSRATVSPQLAAIEGLRSETDPSGLRTVRWRRADTGFEVTSELSSEKGRQEWAVPHEGDAMVTASAMILFARLAMPGRTAYACKGFDPRKGPDDTAIEPTKLEFAGPGPWKGRSAFLVTGSQGANAFTIALDPESRDLIGMRMESDGKRVADMLVVEDDEPGEPEPPVEPPAAEPPAVESKDPLASAMASPSATGMLVTLVVPGGQSEKLGVKVGDILVSYGGVPTPDMGAVRQAKAVATGKESVTALFVRAGEKVALEYRPGSLAVYLMPVVKGETAEGLSPATGVEFDFSSLRTRPRDHWYAFHLDGKTKVGFERGTMRIDEKGQLVYRREIAYDGGEEYGLTHFRVTVTAKAQARPVVLRTRFENLLDGSHSDGNRVMFGIGPEEWQVRWANKATGESGSLSIEARDDYVSYYLIEALVPFLPREKGACLHFRPLSEMTGDAGPVAALYCVGREEILLKGVTIEAWLYEQRKLGLGTTVRYYVDSGGSVVLATYSRARVVIGEKASVLDGLNEGLVPREEK